MRVPSFESVVDDLTLLRRRGLVALRQLHLPALNLACQLCEAADAGQESAPSSVEELLRLAVEGLGPGKLGEAAGLAFGLVPGTREWPAHERRRRGAKVYAVSVDRFRKHYERLVVEQTADQILGLCVRSARSAEVSDGGYLTSESPDGAVRSVLRSVEEAEDFTLSRLLADAVEVDLYGFTLVNLLSQYAPHFSRLIRGGGELRLLVLDPALDIGEMLYPLVPGDGGTTLRHHLENTASRLKLFRAAGESSTGSVAARTVPFIPPCSIVRVGMADERQSRMVVQINLMFARTGRDRPLICLDYDNPWFEVFAAEFEEAWQRGTEWGGQG